MSSVTQEEFDALNQDYEALVQFLYMAPIGILQCSLAGDILMVNPLCAQILMPLSPTGEMSNLFTALESLAPDLRRRVADYTGEHGMICDAVALQVNPTNLRKDAQMLSLSLLKLEGGRLMAILADITESTRRDRELRQSQAWINTIVTGLTDYALVPVDEAGRIQAWNPSIGRVTGQTPDAAVGQSYALFYPEGAMSPERSLDRLDEAEKTGWSLDEGWRARADGTRFWGSCLIAPLHAQDSSDDERAFSLIIRDVSDRREATEALRRSVSCDHLTGLANRRAFFEAGELEFKRWERSPRPLSVVLFDADHFKQINDSHGHAAGDAVLRHLATTIASCFRELDVVARLGGEEFVALLPGTDVAGAHRVAQRVCERIAATAVDFNGTQIRYTISAGAAAMEAGVMDLATLIHRADIAMYGAKEAGRNRVLCWSAELAPRGAAPPR